MVDFTLSDEQASGGGGTGVEATRVLTWTSAGLLDQPKRNTLASSHAKRFAAGTAIEVPTDAVKAYEGYGFIKEDAVES